MYSILMTLWLTLVRLAGTKARRSRRPAFRRPLLEVLEDRLARGVTPAEELLAKYHGEWGGSVDPIYTEEAY